jgi:hypothetical protein
MIEYRPLLTPYGVQPLRTEHLKFLNNTIEKPPMTVDCASRPLIGHSSNRTREALGRQNNR